MTIHDEVAALRNEQDKKRLEAERLERLGQAFPDLQKYVGRRNKVAFYSKTVNSRVNRFDLRHNCGCCRDSPLELWPYLETPDGNVYSDPPKFTVGEQHWIAGDRPQKGWKGQLQRAGLPEVIIGAVEMHFQKGIEERKSLAESESEYDPDSEDSL